MRAVVLIGIAILILVGSACSQESQSAATSESRVTIGVRGGLNLATMTGRLWGVSRFFTDSYADDPTVIWTGGFSKSGVSGMVLGGFLNYRISKSFSIQPELLYTKKGVKSGGAVTLDIVEVGTISWDLTEKLNLTYLEIPVLAKFSIPMRGRVHPGLFAGPSLALKLSGKYEYENLVNNNGTIRHLSAEPKISNMKSTDLGIVVGGDIGIPIGRATLVIDLRYTVGLKGQFGTSGTEKLTGWEYDEIPPEFPVALFDNVGAIKSVPDMKNSAVSITAGVAFDL